MRTAVRILLPALALLPGGGPLSASSLEAVEWETSVSGGVRRFDLSWRTAMAPTGSSLNPAFTFAWNGITAVEADLGLCVHNQWLQLRGGLTYGRIVAGDSTSAAFADDRREQTTYRSQQRSDGGDTREGTLALGLRWGDRIDTLAAVYEVGFTRSEQRLTLTDGVETTPATGAYAGLDSRYHACWEGPWLGVSGTWNLLDRWALLARCRYQVVRYRGDLDLNLRSDLAQHRSIEQAGDGYAVAVAAGIAWHLAWKTDLDLLLSHEDWRVADGRDRVNHRDGSSDDVRLDDVNLSAWVVRLGLRWEY
jgi:hypothetical protein